MAGTVIAVDVSTGQAVAAGAVLAVVEAMKMHHSLHAEHSGRVEDIRIKPGDIVAADDVVVVLDPSDAGSTAAPAEQQIDLDEIRPDLAALFERRAKLLDEDRPQAVGRRHDRGMRTARENIADLTDDGLLVEYGGFAVAAQRGRRTISDLEAATPRRRRHHGPRPGQRRKVRTQRSTCAIVAYDYTVLSGTQGHFGHRKTDRILQLAWLHRYPVVLFAEDEMLAAAYRDGSALNTASHLEIDDVIGAGTHSPLGKDHRPFRSATTGRIVVSWSICRCLTRPSSKPKTPTATSVSRSARFPSSKGRCQTTIL